MVKEIMCRISSKTIRPLTHFPLNKMAAISQKKFSDGFSFMNRFVFCFEFHWSLFLRVQFRIFQHWFRQWLGAE